MGASGVNDAGVSTVIGTLIMLAIVISMIPALIALRENVSREMAAQADVARANAEAAERSAYCARNPQAGPPACEPQESFPGYDCSLGESGKIVCTPSVKVKVDASGKGNLTS